MAQDMKKPDGNDIDLKMNGDEVDIVSESKFLRWWDNYWYHYKWHTIIGAFALFLFLFCTIPLLTDPVDDVGVAYCGPYGFTSEETEALRDTLERIMPEDFDGNGDKYVEIVRYQVYSEQEMKQEQEALGANSVNLPYNAQQQKDFDQFMMLGEVSIYFLSEYMYDHVKDRGGLKPLADVLGEVPENAYDAYAVRVSDLPRYALEPALQKLPADTLVCITAQYQLGGNAKDEIYQRALDMFRALVLGE